LKIDLIKSEKKRICKEVEEEKTNFREAQLLKRGKEVHESAEDQQKVYTLQSTLQRRSGTSLISFM